MKSNLFNGNKRIYVFALLFVILIVAPVILNSLYNYQLKPVNPKNNENQIFIVQPGTPVVTIAENLSEKNLIKNVLTFRLLIARLGIGKNIQAGDFRLSPSMSSRTIAEQLTHGAIDIWITLPEGLRIEEQAEILDENLNFSDSELNVFEKDEYLDIAFEGYMFPDTYLIPRDATAEQVVKILRDTFDKKVGSQIFSDARKNNLTESQLITLASLIEREAKGKIEKPIIAGILLNRIRNGIALQVDATVQYGKGYDSANNVWWPQITRDDYRQVNSKYNTYLITGLPPGPISSPGLDSIFAAANPETSDYFYYLHDFDGNIHYAQTIDGHNENFQKFRN